MEGIRIGSRKENGEETQMGSWKQKEMLRYDVRKAEWSKKDV